VEPFASLEQAASLRCVTYLALLWSPARLKLMASWCAVICDVVCAAWQVRVGYYLNDANTGERAYKCVVVDACPGGAVYGENSCRPGHMGLLCGRCREGFYRGRRLCESCAALSSTGSNVTQPGAVEPDLEPTALLLLRDSCLRVRGHPRSS
jgi:hypothetical protein